MATQGNLNSIPGLKAAADLSSYQFRFVTWSAADKVTYCSTTGEPALGVLQDTPDAAGKAANVAGFNGTRLKVEAGAAVTAGAYVMTDTVGRAITHTTGLTRLGRADSAASAAGEMIEVYLIPYGAHSSTNTGTIRLPFATAREIASNDIQNLAAHGGLLASDSVPAFARANGATDKAFAVTWAASEVDEIQFAEIALPADLDSSADMTIHLYGKSGGATDTPTVDCQVFFNVGDTECGAASSAFGATVGEEYATISAANIPAAPGVMNVALIPGAHTTDSLVIYAAWIEFTKVGY